MPSGWKIEPIGESNAYRRACLGLADFVI